MITKSVIPFKKIVNKTFLVFSSILFLIITFGAVAAYSISVRQINHSYIEQQLSIASETMRLRFATTVNSELALVLKMADTPVIKQYFMNPFDPALKYQAYDELTLFQEHFENKMVFWVSDADKMFYSTGNEPYIVNPDDPESYWYNLTLYETEKFNFNINYNPDLDRIYLWVNVPVFSDADAVKKPIGMLGTGINLTDFSNFVASGSHKFDENINSYMFNKYDEITSAVNYELVQNKVRLEQLLGEAGKELSRIAHELSGGESRSFIYEKKIYHVNSIPTMEWYLTVSYPLPGLLALNPTMNTVFFSMLFLILFLFIIINIFIARSENAMAEQNKQLVEANQKAEMASRSKSDFLAKMSHEIRTPMNAIIGMAELLMRGELSDESRGEVQDIKQAGANLLSIINDILDFSKIESGKLEIVSAKYLLSSLINDTVNIIRTRLNEKPLRFFTNIDGSIPNNLIGDEVRLRQIILNLLTNAVKYTEKGHIGLTITTEKRDDKQIWLSIAVVDTGKGIKPEDQDKLFDEFVQVDTKKNRGIEGTGLGLAITKHLCIAMGGDISMESEYGKGSVFTALIPQVIESETPFAAVEETGKKKVLVYEGRAVYAGAVCWSLKNMNVPHTMVTTQDEFAAALRREEWFYIFSGYGLFARIESVMKAPDMVFYEGKKPPLALMIEWGMEAFVPGVRFVSIPVQSLSIANVLNGKADSKDYTKSFEITRSTYPSARLLVVDDIATNLKVVEGLLSPYRIKVDTCLTGKQSIELVKCHEYDLIFMDHMMPEMDGIEATAAIRKWEKEQQKKNTMSSSLGETKKNLRKQIPIIALTANAVVGMREMFIENGFNDFLSKPIDISNLDIILENWIPKEKKVKSSELKINDEQVSVKTEIKKSKENENNKKDKQPDKNVNSSLPVISGIDTTKGLAMTGGVLTTYKHVLSLFCSDVEERLPLLQKTPTEDTLPALVTQIHALKSASGSIGAQEVSTYAAGLEAVGKAGDTAFIRESLPSFTQQLTELVKNIRAALDAGENIPANNNQEPANDNQETDDSFSVFHELANALKSQNVSEIDRILEDLNQRKLDSKTKELVEKIFDRVLITEFDSAMEILDKILNKEILNK